MPITAPITFFMSYRIRSSMRAVNTEHDGDEDDRVRHRFRIFERHDTGCLHGKREQECSDLYGDEQEGHCEEGDQVFCIQTGISEKTS